MDDVRFETVWKQHAAAVLRYCTFSAGSAQEGEDVAAETFAQFLARGDSIAAENTEAWLIRVARNLCASHHRAQSRQHRLTERIASSAPTHEDEWIRPDSWEYVRRLSESQRLVVYLRIAEDRTFSDVARLLNKSEAATKVTFYRALDRLGRLMRADGAETASERVVVQSD